MECDVNKAELIDRLHEESGVAKGECEKVLNAFIEVVQAAVTADDKITLPGFGVFSQTLRSARQARNPRTGEMIDVPATKAAKFSVGAKFKAQVSGR